MSEKIRVLNNKEQARMKIHVWHGSSSNWINMIKELVGNSLDIFKKNFSKDIVNSIQIKIHNKNKIEYIDSGTGIPIEGKASDGSNNYEAIFERPFAGSNYENEYATVGTNGVFLYTLAMTCEDIEFFIGRPDGNIYNIAYHKGNRIKELSIIGKTDKTFSKIIFSLDTEVWDNPNFTFEEIKSIVKGQASLSNTKIFLKDIEHDILEEYYYKNGIKDYFEELTKNKSMLIDSEFIVKELQQKISRNDTIDNIKFNMVFNFSNDSEDNTQKDFLNTADLIQHGTIKDGIILGFKNAIHKYLKDNSKYDKKDKGILLEDIETSLNFICDLNSYNAEYVSQVKQQTLSPHYKIAMKNSIEEFCEMYFNENKVQADIICNQVLINSKARLKAETSRLSIKKELEKGANSAITRPDKFTPCVSKDKSKICLILTEGDSAKEPMRKARDKNTMALYALRGKVINALKNDINDVLKNNEVKDIFKILQCGMEYKGKPIKGINKYNEDNLAYNNVSIATDADEDGKHIRSLIICLFYVLAPNFIKNGHLYSLLTPLYKIETKKEHFYAYSETEKDELIKNIQGKYSLKRFKGLGSLTTEILAETAMNEENRILERITWDDAEKCKEVLMLCMSDDKQKERKEFIENYGDKYFDIRTLEV